MVDPSRRPGGGGGACGILCVAWAAFYLTVESKRVVWVSLASAARPRGSRK